MQKSNSEDPANHTDLESRGDSNNAWAEELTEMSADGYWTTKSRNKTDPLEF